MSEAVNRRRLAIDWEALEVAFTWRDSEGRGHWLDLTTGQVIGPTGIDLRAFQSEPELARLFDEMVDGTEVLPASLESEYRQVLDAEPLAAFGLLVSLPASRLHFLRRAGRVRADAADGPIVVDTPYDADQGLRLR
jgi:hypothetical protein